MKAIVYHAYGSPDVLTLEDIATPVVNDDDVLVRVCAASVNPLDWHFMRGTPYPLRMAAGLRRPTITRLGVDVAGRVEAVGRNVGRWQPGDEVFGASQGAFAEFVCAVEGRLVPKPANVTFEQAAAVPVAGLTALQGLRDAGRMQSGQQVLINGAAGGVGTFAVQIARSFGAEVTGVCSTRNVDMVRSIGAAHVVDYTREDFTQHAHRYDLIVDCMANRPLSACRRAMSPSGTYVVIGGPDGRWIRLFARVLEVLVVSRFVSQTLAPCMTKVGKSEDLATLQGLLAAGTVTPVIDRTYPLSEVPEAIRYLEQGHARGKVVIRV